MTNREFHAFVSRCDFMFDWQKERLLAMIDGSDDSDGGDSDGNLLPSAESVLPVLDNVLWRTIGIGLDSLPPMDRVNIMAAVREMAR